MPSTLPRRRVFKLFGGAVALAATTTVRSVGGEPVPLPDGRQGGEHAAAEHSSWIASWATAMVEPGVDGMSRQGVRDCTLRMVVRASVGGASPRIRLSNLHGRSPLVISSASIALQQAGARPRPAAMLPLLFGGSPSVTVPAGWELSSDPVGLSVAARDAVLVSMYLPGPTGPMTWHPRTQDATYLAEGDHCAAMSPERFTRRELGWFYLCGLDLGLSRATGTVVCFGDSITDGAVPRRDTTTSRWPDALAARIRAARPAHPLGVVDLGISGNRLLKAGSPDIGAAGLSRFHRDALGRPGVTDVILLEGINDISFGKNDRGQPLTARDLVRGYSILIGQARKAGVAIHGGTLLPFRGARAYSEANNRIREQVNGWIRKSGAFTSVIDFDRLVRDPFDPQRYFPAFDSGDHLHPSTAGYGAMAEAVDLGSLKG